MRRCPDVGLLLSQRRARWTNSKPTLGNDSCLLGTPRQAHEWHTSIQSNRNRFLESRVLTGYISTWCILLLIIDIMLICSKCVYLTILLANHCYEIQMP